VIGLVPPAIALSLIAVAAAVMTARSARSPAKPLRLRAAAHALAVAAGVQAVHFVEELTTGFHEQFPALFGLPAMPPSLFIAANLVWLVFWGASVVWIRTANPVPLFAAWFLAIAGCANGIVHPLLSVLTGGYFPGLFTSPFIGLAGIWLARRLTRLAD